MKKIITALIVSISLLALTTPGHALLRKDLTTIKGKVLSINARENSVTIDDGSRQPKTFVVKKPLDQSLTAGKQVVVMYKIGTNNASWVRPARAQK
ncbi:MAG: hypothetical protein AB7S78_01150 [Candidatus Omnitrophota bacterium]